MKRALSLDNVRSAFSARVIPLLALLSTLNSPLSTAHAQGTAFTYQGRLNAGGSPANGSYDLTFTLFNVSSGGSAVAGPVTLTATGVTNGLFTVTLDFFGIFYATPGIYWLDIAVRTNGNGSFTELAPREQVTPTPYAEYAEFAGYANPYPHSINSLDFITDNLPTAGEVLGVNAVGGLIWTNPSTVGNFWSLTGNGSTTPGVNFLGTTDANALELHVNGARAWQIVPTGTYPNIFPNIIGGYSGNVVDSGAQGATIGGGGTIGYVNQVSATLGTIAGGSGNVIQAGANDSTIAGGRQNQIGTNSWRSFIGGGAGNIIQTNIQGAVIGGGLNNTVEELGFGAFIGGGSNNFIQSLGQLSVISGGRDNSVGEGAVGAVIGGGSRNLIDIGCLQAVISGGASNYVQGSHATGGENFGTIGGGLGNSVRQYDSSSDQGSTVPGGEYNVAEGFCCFAAGYEANAIGKGVFVWADNNPFRFFNSNDKEFAARATGGVRFVTGIDGSGNPTAGATLASGATSWTALSDRNAKKNFHPVNAVSVLDKLAAIPIEQWNYKWEKDTDVPNIGPMAQDFKQAFFPGRNDKGISTLEFDGVELAAIQGLNQKLNEKDARIQQQGDEIEKLKQSMAELKQLMQSLTEKK